MRQAKAKATAAGAFVRSCLGNHTFFGVVWAPTDKPTLQASRDRNAYNALYITMPIAPITGKLRKRLWLDISCALGLGIASGYAYWSVSFPSSIVKNYSLTLLMAGMAFI